MNVVSEVLNLDCLEYMRKLPDNYFDLVIADPPYGIGEDGAKNHSRGKLAETTKFTPKEWDKKAVSKEILDEILRVSKNQIIWGANHFISKIPYDSSCWIVWDKLNGNSDFADCELAWTSFKTSVRRFSFRWAGMLQGNMKCKEKRIHPTQKPVALYQWLLKLYAKEGDKIYDPFLGSGSSRIAAYGLGYDFYATELDREYYDAQEKRFNESILGKIESSKGELTQINMF